VVAYLLAAALLTVTPGADMAVVTKVALRSGRRAAVAASLGICTGLLAWGAASAVGLAALVRTSPTAFTVLKYAGAAYLVALGAQALWHSRRAAEAPPETRTTRGAFRDGLLSNLLNPKIAVFYTAFLPQFVRPGQPVLATTLLLALVHGVMGLAWLTTYAHLVTRAGDLLRRPRARRVLDRVTGVALVGLGTRLAVARR
jgi:RhtB (resistance to homoserine/threonine) family protein